jgi:hypothetical protein
MVQNRLVSLQDWLRAHGLPHLEPVLRGGEDFRAISLRRASKQERTLYAQWQQDNRKDSEQPGLEGG